MWPSAQISLKQMPQHSGYTLGPADFAGKSELFLLRGPRWGIQTEVQALVAGATWWQL